MEFILTQKYQFRKKCKDGHRRNYLIYFLNDIQILKQKIPFDTSYKAGHDCRTHIDDDFLLNGCIHQKRKNGLEYLSSEERINFQRSITLSDTLDGEKKKHSMTIPPTFSIDNPYGVKYTKKVKIRTTRFPVSKKILKQLEVPNDLKIELSESK
jgi:rRNA maturation protein Nop10